MTCKPRATTPRRPGSRCRRPRTGVATAGEIAADLFLGEATIRTHVSNVLAKSGPRDRVQAVVFAYETGVATPRC